jgi:prevent-host-death family protein
MGIGIREARKRLSDLVKRAAYGEEEIRIGTRGREEASLIATRKLAEMRQEIAQLRRRLALGGSTAALGEVVRPFAALQIAVEAGVFATGGATRRRRVMPGIRTTSALSREDQARLGERNAREPRFRRRAPRA